MSRFVKCFFKTGVTVSYSAGFHSCPAAEVGRCCCHWILGAGNLRVLSMMTAKEVPHHMLPRAYLNTCKLILRPV